MFVVFDVMVVVFVEYGMSNGDWCGVVSAVVCDRMLRLVYVCLNG